MGRLGATYSPKRYNERKREGLCVTCGESDERTRCGKTRCRGCALNANASRRRRRVCEERPEPKEHTYIAQGGVVFPVSASLKRRLETQGVIAKNKCPDCGKFMQSEWKYCPRCGKHIKW